jgi:hypothetical protein
VRVYEFREGRKPRLWDCPLVEFIRILFPSDFYTHLPPLEILNLILRRDEWQEESEGSRHLIGNSLCWESFVLTAKGYQALIDELASEYEISKPNYNIATPEDWELWQRHAKVAVE